MKKGHVAKKEYSQNAKCEARGRRKSGGHSYVCPCCMKMKLENFKALSRRIILPIFFTRVTLANKWQRRFPAWRP